MARLDVFSNIHNRNASDSLLSNARTGTKAKGKEETLSVSVAC
jgi:hypothetical protein